MIDALVRAPRIRFAHLPTPLEPLERLSSYLGGPKVWIKRDDCTGLATGGNKARKLEFLMGDALQKDADTIITQGAVQSNHARQTAAIAARQGLKCTLLLENRVQISEQDYRASGNVLLDQLFDANILDYPGGTDMAGAMQVVADEIRAAGGSPYVIPGGGSNSIGALGYANAAAELLEQADKTELEIDCIVHATGSAGTQAGLLAGLHAIERPVPVLGIGVRKPRAEQEQIVYDLARKTVTRLGVKRELSRDSVRVNCDYVGDGYGLPADGTLEAIRLLARLEGILLDPVYSGKGMAGLIGEVSKGRFSRTGNVVFIHTGGEAALFGYGWAFSSGTEQHIQSRQTRLAPGN
ncbi:MAG: D-cysteine desulfhydrase [Gammaproteobacteria bacterium]|nr:D-cysteine desulfhydrase [Gammaproteobacteria bacterium]